MKLIKPVIANPTDRKEGLRPLSPPYNEKIISIYDDRIVKRTGSENDFGLRVAQYSLIRITKKYFLTRVVECKKKTPGKNRLLALAPKGTDLADGGDRPGRRRIFARCLLHVFKTMY